MDKPQDWSKVVYNKGKNTLTFEVPESQIDKTFLKYLKEANNIPDTVQVIYAPEIKQKSIPFDYETCETCKDYARCNSPHKIYKPINPLEICKKSVTLSLRCAQRLFKDTKQPILKQLIQDYTQTLDWIEDKLKRKKF